MFYPTSTPFLANCPEDCRRTSSISTPSVSELQHEMRQPSEPTIDGLSISGLVDVVRQNLNGDLAKKAVDGIYEILHTEYPDYRYQSNFSIGDLATQLREGIREKYPVVVAFLENETKSPALWKWRIHFAEIGGAGAVISDTLVKIKSPDIGTWRAHSSLKQPVYLEPFGRASRLWSCLSKPWQGSGVTLAFFGHTSDPRRRLVSVRTPPLFP